MKKRVLSFVLGGFLTINLGVNILFSSKVPNSNTTKMTTVCSSTDPQIKN